MKQDRKHIVFFTQTLNRTGSEIVLFNLLPYAMKEFGVTVITKYKGELYDQLPAGVNKHFLYKKQFGGLSSKISNKLRNKFAVDRILNKYHASTWYINTIMLGDILAYAEQYRVRTIIHLHELQQMYVLLSEENKKQLAEYPDQIIANSKASAEVIRQLGRSKPVEVIYPALDFSKIKPAGEDLRKKLSIAEDAFVWVMSGTLDHNKNPFLFVEIAKELKSRNANFRMVWIGGNPGNVSIEQEFVQAIKQNDCSNVIAWVPHTANRYYDYFSLADGFVLTSQFESFSLVTLEALYLQLPVVANPCIGVQEIVQDRYGYVAKEKNNAKELAGKMYEYMSGQAVVDKEAVRRRALDFSIDKIAQQWIGWLKANL